MQHILWLNGTRIYESSNRLNQVKHLAAMKICSMYGCQDGVVSLIWKVVAYGRDNKPVLYKAKGFDCVITVVEEQ